MQRFIGGVLILTATAGAGYVYGMELKSYLETMRYLRYVVSLIKGEISYSGTPLQKFSQRWRKESGNLTAPVRGMARELENRTESGFARAWNKCTDRYLKPLRLKYEHVILLKERVRSWQAWNGTRLTGHCRSI